MKLAAKLDGADQETLRRGTQTIVAQVAAMKHMVDDFAIYARQPRPGRCSRSTSGALLQDVLALYDNLRPHVVACRFPTAPVVIQGEPTRLRQVFHNLLQNAIDAQADVERARVTTSRSPCAATRSRSRSATRGAGISPTTCCAHAFEPYVTTKAKGTGPGPRDRARRSSTNIAAASTLENRAPHGARVDARISARASRGSVG